MALHGQPGARAAPVAAAADAPLLVIHVELSPAGSFTAESRAAVINGGVRKGGNATIASISLPLDSLSSGIALRDEHMKRKYFEIQKHPIAVLKGISAQEGRFTAKLLLRGVEKEIEGEYQLKGQGAVARFKTTLSDFNIPEPRYMGVGVEDEVEVEFTLPKL
jgi:polyisoprenoid-binding protein YceI